MSSARNCTFCDIIEGKAEALAVYEDLSVKAIADANPVAPGHILIIPKTHYEAIFDMPEDEFLETASAAKKLAGIFKSKLNVDGLNFFNASGSAAQQSVLHFHIHMIPRYAEDGIDLDFHGNPKLKAESWKVLKGIAEHPKP